LIVNAKPRTVAGLFSGVGGIELGFQQAGFDVALANEIDPYAATTYRKNHHHELVEGDIATLESGKLPKDLGILTGGFPCQPFSVAGYRKGFDDERGNVFWDIERLFVENAPEVVFLENVKNLKGHDSGNTFRTIEASLRKAGYFVDSAVLNSTTHGNIPQNRERIYIVAFKSHESFSKFEWPESIPLTTKLSDLIDFQNKMDDRYYYTAERPFYDKLVEDVTEESTIYQWRRQYVRSNKSGVCPTLTANMGTGGHNVPLIKTKWGVRKLTPRECFNLMGFPSDFVLPSELAQSRLYKQAGNAVVVPVIRRIAERISMSLGVSNESALPERELAKAS